MRCAIDVISLSNVVATAILATPRKAAVGNQPGRPASGDGRALPSGDGWICTGGSAGPIRSGDTSASFALALLQNQPDAMQVGGQHRQGNRTREAVDTMMADTVEPPVLQPVDGRLNRRVHTARGREGCLFLPGSSAESVGRTEGW